MASSMVCPVRWFFSSAVATRDAVQEPAEVHGLGRVGLERELARDREPVRVAMGGQLRSNPERRLAIREANLYVLIAHAVGSR